MSCSCRVAPWRAFVQGLAQVHKVDSPGTMLHLGRQPQNLRSTLPFRTYSGNTRQLRSLHVSPRRAQEEAAPHPSPEKDASDVTVSSVKDTTETSAATSAEASPAESAETTQRNDSRAEPKTSTFESKKRQFAKTSFEKKKGPAGKAREPRQPRNGPTEVAESDELNQPRPKEPEWLVQKRSLKEKFPDGWNPRKRLSPDALAGIRALNAQFPDVYTTSSLAAKFEVSPEAIRRILKSKWQPTVAEEQDRQDRWFKRGKAVWERKAALGIKPPKKWREEGIARDPGYHEWSKRATKREQTWEQQEKARYRARIEERKQEKPAAGWPSKTAGKAP